MYDLLPKSEILEEELNLRIEIIFQNPAGYKLGFKLEQHNENGKPVDQYRIVGVPMYSDNTIIKDVFALPIQVLEAYVIMFNRIKAWKTSSLELELLSAEIDGVEEIKLWKV